MAKKGGKKNNKAKPKGGPPKLPTTAPAHEGEDNIVAGEAPVEETKIDQTTETEAPAAASESTAPEKDVSTAPAQEVSKELDTKLAVESKEEDATLPVREKDAAAEKPVEKPVEKLAEEPAEAPVEKAVAKPVEAPVEKPAEKPVETPAEAKTEALAAAKPTETKAEKPAEKVAEKIPEPAEVAQKDVTEQPSRKISKEELLQATQEKVAQTGGPQASETALETGALGAAVGAAGVAGTAAAVQPEKTAAKEPNGHVLESTPSTAEASHVKRSHEEPLFAIPDRDQPLKKAKVEEAEGKPAAATAAKGQEPAMSATLAEPFSQAAIVSPSSAPVSAEQQTKPETAPVQKEPAPPVQAEKPTETPLSTQNAEPTARPINPAVSLPAEPKPAAKPSNGRGVDQEAQPTDTKPAESTSAAQKEAKKGGFMSWIKRKFKGDKATA